MAWSIRLGRGLILASLLLVGVSAAQPPFNEDWLDKLTFLHQRGVEARAAAYRCPSGQKRRARAELERRGAQNPLSAPMTLTIFG